jgi:hypothetical protein
VTAGSPLSISRDPDRRKPCAGVATRGEFLANPEPRGCVAAARDRLCGCNPRWHPAPERERSDASTRPRQPVRAAARTAEEVAGDSKRGYGPSRLCIRSEPQPPRLHCLKKQ